MRSAVAARCFTWRVLQDSTLPPPTRFSGQRPSQEAKAEALQNLLTSVPISVSTTCAVPALLQYLKQRDPVHSCRLHRHALNPAGRPAAVSSSHVIAHLQFLPFLSDRSSVGRLWEALNEVLPCWLKSTRYGRIPHGLSGNNREIRALFAHFGAERTEFLCS